MAITCLVPPRLAVGPDLIYMYQYGVGTGA